MLNDTTHVHHLLVRVTANRYRELGIYVLGYDLLRDDDTWVVSEINAGNVGGLFRLQYLGVAGITDRLVDWLCRYAERSREPVGPPAVDPVC